MKLVQSAVRVVLHGDLTSFGLGKVNLDKDQVVYLVRNVTAVTATAGRFCIVFATLDGVEYKLAIKVVDGIVFVNDVKER